MKAATKFYVILISIAVFCVPAATAQTPIAERIKPDYARILSARQDVLGPNSRNGGHEPYRKGGLSVRPPVLGDGVAQRSIRPANGTTFLRTTAESAVTTSIPPGTPLSRILHTSELSLVSSAGEDEQFVDRNNDGVADERTTFDNDGGSFDIAVGQSGARYEVYSATLQGVNIGVLVVASDTNGNYIRDSSSTYDLHRDFSLPSAAAVVTGVSRTGREFVIVSSSGYYNSSNPNDPNNEPSPGVVLLVRDPATGGFDNALSRSLVTVGDNKLYNANALALLPNNDLLIADFHSDELRIVRDTNGDGLPDTLSNAPYYSYLYSNDAPLDIAVNSRGVVFSHSAGNDMVMLAIYDDNQDGTADHDEVCVAGLSIDNNLFLHGLTVDRVGSVYVIQDAAGAADGPGGNGGSPRVDAFIDPGMNGFLRNASIFTLADFPATDGMSGISFGAVPPNPINDSRSFVRQQYLDFLGREPDDGGWDYWTLQLTRCDNDARCINAQRISVSAAFFVELEFQETGSFVYRFYRASFGRQPNFSEFQADRSQVIGGADLEAKKQAFANAWVNRAQFQQAYPANLTIAQFVNKLFDTAALTPFGTERQQLIADMQSGKTRAQAVRDVTEIAAFKTREYNPSFVLMQYFGYLQRDPDQGGYDFWLNVLNNREPNNYRGMVCAFITSREYQERFGLQLSRTNVDCA